VITAIVCVWSYKMNMRSGNMREDLGCIVTLAMLSDVAIIVWALAMAAR